MSDIPKKSTPAWVQGVGVCLILGILAFVNFWPIGYSYRHRLQNLSLKEVNSIQVAREAAPSGYTKLDLNPEQRVQFLRLLAGAKLLHPNHPKAVGHYYARIQAGQERFDLMVYVTSNKGSYISRAGDGWNYGNLRNDGLRDFFEKTFATK